MNQFTVKYNELTAEEFIYLKESVGGVGQSLEQTKIAMEHSIFRVSIFDGDQIIGMARMIGDFGLDYYIKDVAVRPDYQKQGLGRLLIEELLKFIRENGVHDTEIYVELCAMPKNVPFYEKFGFDCNEAKRMKMMYPVG